MPLLSTDLKFFTINQIWAFSNGIVAFVLTFLAKSSIRDAALAATVCGIMSFLWGLTLIVFHLNRTNKEPSKTGLTFAIYRAGQILILTLTVTLELFVNWTSQPFALIIPVLPFTTYLGLKMYAYVIRYKYAYIISGFLAFVFGFLGLFSAGLGIGKTLSDIFLFLGSFMAGIFFLSQMFKFIHEKVMPDVKKHWYI